MRILATVNSVIYHNSAYELCTSVIYFHKMLVTAYTMHHNVVNFSEHTRIICSHHLLTVGLIITNYAYDCLIERNSLYAMKNDYGSIIQIPIKKNLSEERDEIS